MRSINVTGPDGKHWHVFRRRVAWRPWLPRWAEAPDVGSDGGGIFDLIAGGLLLIFTLIAFPVWLWYFGSWMTSLIATPFVANGRKSRRRATPVIAQRSNAERDEWAGQADGFGAAEYLIIRVVREIQAYGEPRSLTPPRPRKSKH